MSELVTWANGDGTFSYIPESQVPSMMSQTSTSSNSLFQGIELIDVLFLGALIIITIATWKEPIGYFTLGLLVAWILLGMVD